MFWAVLLLLPWASLGQTPPECPNRSDAQGRQGWWKLCFDELENPADRCEDAAFFRILRYKNGRPAGGVAEYLADGKLWRRWDGALPDGETPQGGVRVFNEEGSWVDYEYYEGGELDFEKSLRVMEQLQRRYERRGGPALALCQASGNAGVLHYYMGHYKEAERCFRISYQYSPPNTQDQADALNNLANVYQELGQMDLAEKTFLEALALEKSLKNGPTSDYGVSLGNLGTLYMEVGRVALAGQYFREALSEIVASGDTIGEGHGLALNNMGAFLEVLDSFGMAEAFYRKAMYVDSVALGPNHPKYAQSLSNLAVMYLKVGRYAEAERMKRHAMAIVEAAYGPLHSEYAMGLNDLAYLLETQGNLIEAERLYLQAIQVMEQSDGDQDLALGNPLNNLAMLYLEWGQYDKGKACLARAMRLHEALAGTDSPDYALYLHNMAQLHWAMDDTAQAFQTMRQALALSTTSATNRARYLNGYADMLAAAGNFQEALDTMASVGRLYAEHFGEESLRYADVQSSVGWTYCRMGKWEEALAVYQQVEAVYARALGEGHLDRLRLQHRIGLLHLEMGDIGKAQQYMLSGAEALGRQLRQSLPHFSEKERASFLRLLGETFEACHSLAYRQASPPDSLLDALLQQQLLTKAAIFRSGQQVRDQVLQSRSRELLRLYQAWQDQQQQLVAARQLSAEQQRRQGMDLGALSARADSLEKDMLQRFEALEGLRPTEVVSLPQLRQALQPGEAVVEIVRFRLVREASLSDSVVYVAYILPPQGPMRTVYLPGNELEGQWLTFYRNAIRYRLSDELSYGHFWGPIQQALPEGTRRVYVSADGAYHQINLLTLQAPGHEQYVADQLDIRLLGNVGEVVKLRQGAGLRKRSHIVLFGYPAYGGDAAAGDSRALPDSLPDAGTRFFGSQAQVPPLPGTRDEVLGIGEMLQEKGVSPRLFLEDEATETQLRAVEAPDLLHIATHGFFRQSQEPSGGAGERGLAIPALRRSGLLLANCLPALRGQVADARDDGILHADEVQGMRLQGTELVILSACETGLGEVAHGEGVYGLQRAFQQAGARSVLMSLWKVSDEATQQMMGHFYRHYLQGQDKREAFRLAQEALRRDFPHPYFWGAFVMVGE
jgi:CHAT domain-containing protein/tetratricopeptide (TPR) repeat protein